MPFLQWFYFACATQRPILVEATPPLSKGEKGSGHVLECLRVVGRRCLRL